MAGIPGEATRILRRLASEWGDVMDCDAVEVVHLKGAMTNEVYEIKWPTSDGGKNETPRKVLVRIYGEGVDVFFDRADEIRTFECISRLGYGPCLLGRFPSGRVEEFIHARTLSASDLRDHQISSLIAAKLWEFHGLDMPGEKKAAVWARLKNWLNTAKHLCSLDESKEFSLDSLDKEISTLQSILSSENQKMGFCHNDLQYGNIMMDEETKTVTIIDYEYASFNPIAFDIANHFCEMAADYHTETPHILNYNKYPGLEEQKRFVRTYLASSGREPEVSEVEGLIRDIERYTVISHLLWGLWGIISVHVNKIDFDYEEYARQRFQQYQLNKSIVL